MAEALAYAQQEQDLGATWGHAAGAFEDAFDRYLP